MTKTKTKTAKPAAAKVACDKCGTMFKPAKPWQRFCSTACRVADHGAGRYAENRKARRALPKIVDDLVHVEAALVASDLAAGLDMLRRVIRRAKGVAA